MMTTWSLFNRISRKVHLSGAVQLIAWIVLLICTDSSLGQDINWNNVAGGSWTTVGNWDPMDVPNNTTENAVITLPGTYTIDLDTDVVVGSLLLTNPNATISIATTSGANTSLILAGDSQIDGTINLITNFDSREVSLEREGTIINNGTINAQGTGTGFAIRRLTADTFENTANGTINVHSELWLNENGGAFDNSGAFNIAPGATVSTWPTATFNQNGGTLDNQGTFMFSANAFNVNGGMLDNQGTFTVSSSPFNFNGGTLAGNPIELLSSTLNIGAGNTNAGTFLFQLPSNFFSGDLAAAQTLNIEAIPSFEATVVATSDFTNNGTINLITNFDSREVSLEREGTIVNNGTINAQGTGTGFAIRRLTADTFENTANGTINVHSELWLNENGGAFDNSGAFNIAPGATVSTWPTATFNQNGGTLNNQGTFMFSANAFNVNGGMLDNQGVFTVSSSPFNFNGGTLTGNPIELLSSTLNIGAGNTNAGTFLFQLPSNFFSGDLAAAQTLNIEAIPSFETTVVATSDFTNNGTIVLRSEYAGNDATLERNGTITNNGIFEFHGVDSANRIVSASLFNHGVVEAFADSTIGRSGANHVNAGRMRVNDPSVLLQITGSSFVNDTGGVIEGVGEVEFAPGMIATSRGVISPGLSAGQLTIDGDLILLSDSTIEIELGGTIQGTNYDFIDALDLLGVNGSLNVSLIDGFESSITSSDVFTIVSARTLIGEFTGISDGDTIKTTDSRWEFVVTYAAGNVILSNATAIPEPATCVITILSLLMTMQRRRRNSG